MQQGSPPKEQSAQEVSAPPLSLKTFLEEAAPGHEQIVAASVE
jgi:hypothetical protein